MERWGVAAVVGMLVLVSTGCGGLFPKAPPSRFYVLGATAEPAAAGGRLSIGVGPVQLPGYTDRLQIATRTGANEIDYAERDRWATPLDEGVTRVLLIDLARLLGTDRVSEFPFALGAPRDYDVSVAFLHFEPDAGGQVLVEALWRITRAATGEELLVRQASFSRPAAAGDFAAATAALSQALGDLAAEIAGALRQLRAAP